MEDKVVRINITGKVAYADEITAHQAAQIIALLNSESAHSPKLGVSPLPHDFTGEMSKGKSVENPRDALDISGASTNPEKIVALGAYVLQDGGETFKAEDIKTQFRRARESAPGNFARDLNAAIASGWVAEGKDGEYYLTNKVAGILEGGFTFSKSTSVARSRPSRKSGTRPKAARVVPDSLSSIEAFDAVMAGFPPYAKMKTEKDRLLWVVLYMREHHQRNGLSNKEIEFISDTVGVGIPNGHITGAFNTAKAAGYANRSTQDSSIRITDQGVAYLRTAGEKAEG